MRRKKIELLAPAGSPEALRAAIANGADAVYLGGKSFGARAFANNFDREAISEAVRYAHLRGVAIYVAMNTLLNDYEMSKALDEVEFYYRNNVDALIIQDLGLYAEVKRRFPDFRLHASTQMHIHNVAGVRFAKSLGLERVVVARETPLSLLKKMCQEGIEIEAFVHGAICVSYSGQCLISSSLMNRSGNKGVCAQCCRLPYKVIDAQANRRIESQENFVLSTHDMNELEDVAILIEAGVSSLKIEGRMKKAAYVGYVTRQYRQAIDAYYTNSKYYVSREVVQNMEALFSRGFTNAYLHDKGAKDLYSQKHSNHRGVKAGVVIAYEKGKAIVRLEKNLSQFDGVRFENNNEDGFIINRLYDRNDYLISSSCKGNIIKLDAPFYVKKGTTLLCTSDYQLEKSVALEGVYKKIPIQLKMFAKIGEILQLKLDCENDSICATSSYRVEESINSFVDKDLLLNHIDRFQDTPFSLTKSELEVDDRAFLPVKIVKELRRKAIAKMIERRENKCPHRVIETNYPRFSVSYLEKEIIEYSQEHQRSNNKSAIFCSEYPRKDDYRLYPVVNPLSIYPKTDNAVISEVGGLLLPLKHKIAGVTLNCCNRACYEFYRSLGCEAVVVSSELNQRELLSFSTANLAFHRFAYGRRDLMNLKYNPFEPLHINSIDRQLQLELQGKRMTFLRRENRNVILEADPIVNDQNLGIAYRRYTSE